MQIIKRSREIAAALLAVIVVGCGPSAETQRKADSAVAAASKAKAVTEAGEVFSARREAQTYFDSARKNFVAKHRAAAAKSLRDAALFTRQQSDSATGIAKSGLTASATELEGLASRVTKGTVTSVKTLDYAFARTQFAEARFHHMRAAAALQTANAATAGAELVILADHFERGTADAGRALTASAKSTVADVRALAARLTQGSTVVPADVESTMAAMDKELVSATAAAAKLKR